jgi:hypothetical protein
MTCLTRVIRCLGQLTCTLLTLLGDGVRYCVLCLRSPATLATENLLLRKLLVLYQERPMTPKRATNATRIALVWLGRWCDWRHVLAIVQPVTFIRWHRNGFRLFWRWKSRPRRPPLPANLRALIRLMARDNPGWGKAHLANELLLKLGLHPSPRTVRKSIPTHPHGGRYHHFSSQG